MSHAAWIATPPASLLGVPEALFESAFALNDHGFVLMRQGPQSQVPQPEVVYANASYLRLCGYPSPGAEGDLPPPAPAGAVDAVSRVLSEQAPTSYLGYEPDWQRWIHLYAFPAAAGMAGAFIADPALLTEGGDGLQRSPADFGDLVIDYPARKVTLNGDPVQLTRTEYDLLALLAQAPNRVVSRPAALRALWDTSWLGSSPALDVHVSRLRRKLGESGARPRYIHSVRGSGLIFVPDHGN